jgi:hypothetical protein
MKCSSQTKSLFLKEIDCFMGLNYKHSELLFFQVGYLHQFDYKINDEIGRDFLLVGLYFDFFRKPSKMNE